MKRLAWIVTEFPDYYPKLLQGLISLADVIQTLLQTLIIGFGLMVILAVMLIVEQHGIHDGLTWFLEDESLAVFAAWGFVLMNFVGEFQIAHVEYEEKFKEARSYDWSVALIWREVAYRIGVKPSKAKTAEWKPRAKSPAHRFYAMQRWVTVAIFLLALSGRMKPMIIDVSTNDTGQSVALAQGLTDLQTQSTLGDVVTWVLGTVFTMVALIGVQGLTGYVAVRVLEIREHMERRVRAAKATATRERNRAGVRAVRGAGAASAVPGTRTVIEDVFELDRLRDNTLEATRDGSRYICPKCGKNMSRQGWSGHPFRFKVDVVALSGQARKLVDEHLTGQAQVDRQADVQLEQAGQAVSQFSVNGKGGA